jgi:hypothetical protein
MMKTAFDGQQWQKTTTRWQEGDGGKDGIQWQRH